MIQLSHPYTTTGKTIAWSELPCPPPGIFLTRGSNPCLLRFLHWQAVSLPLGPPRNPIYVCVYVYIYTQYVLENIFKLVSHQRNANQNHDTTSCPIWCYNQKDVITGVVDVEKLDSSCTASGNVNGQPLWRTVWQYLKRLSIELPKDPVVPL